MEMLQEKSHQSASFFRLVNYPAFCSLSLGNFEWTVAHKKKSVWKNKTPPIVRINSQPLNDQCPILNGQRFTLDNYLASKIPSYFSFFYGASGFPFHCRENNAKSLGCEWFFNFRMDMWILWRTG